MTRSPPARMRRRAGRQEKSDDGWRRFSAEAAYADSIVRCAIGDVAEGVAAAERALKILPTYAPAILSVGSIAYQRRQKKRGRRPFLSLLELTVGTEDLAQIIDEAGDFLIGRREYADGFELYSRAVERFADVVELHQRVGCCAGHLRRHAEAVAASRRAVELDPTSQILRVDPSDTSAGVRSPFFVGCHSLASRGRRRASERPRVGRRPVQYGHPVPR